MDERQHLELVQRNDIYIKVGSGYRLITDKRDRADNLIDLGYNLYTTPNFGRQYIKFLDGPKGDIIMPAGAAPLPPIEKSASKQVGQAADVLLGKTVKTAGCAITGCGWYILILIGLGLIGFIAMLLGAKPV